jgi:Tol biopolymer transport system component
VQRERAIGPMRAPWLRAWLVVGLAAWTLVGVLLVTRANMLGLVDDITFSPYHLVGYAAILVLGAYVAWTFFRALRRGTWRQAFPPLYGGLGLGFLLIVAWIVLDPIWRDTLGISENIEGGLAPTRLLIPAALVLLAIGPVREAISLRRYHGMQQGERLIRWAGVAGAGVVGAALTIVAFNPISNPVSDWSYRPAVDNSEIWTMAADGSGQTRLLAALGDGVDYSLPAWSPDGTRIAFTTWTNDGGVAQNIKVTDQIASIWTAAADGSDRRAVITVADADAWIPAWSPDGAWLTYTVTPHATTTSSPGEPQANPAPGQVGPPSGAASGSQVWIAKADGTVARRLTAEGIDATGAAWSPDGTRIAFVAGASNVEPDIHVATVTDAGLTDERVVGAERGNDWGPAWSPDGASIAFVSDRSGNDEVWIVGVAGGEARKLTESTANDWVPVFAAGGTRIGGTRILFVSDRTGEPEIWSMAPDGSDLRNLTNHPAHFDGTWSVAVSPDGSRVAYGNAAFQDPVTSGWVREDLAAAQALLFGLALAAIALVLVALGAPFGAFAIALLIVTLAGAIPVDGWRFIPGALIAGLAVDGIVAVTRRRWRSRVAAAALPALANVGMALTIGAAGTLFWSVTLVLGVAVASAVIGWALAEAVERLLQHPAPGSVPTAAEAPAS